MNTEQSAFFAKAFTEAWAAYLKSTPNQDVCSVFQADVKSVIENQLEKFMGLYDSSRLGDEKALVFSLGPMITNAMAAHIDKLPALTTISNECKNYIGEKVDAICKAMRKAFPLYVKDNFPNDGELRNHVVAKVQSPNHNDGMSLTPMYSNISTTESHPHIHMMLKKANAVTMLHSKLFKGNKSLTDRLTDMQADIQKSEKLFDERRDGRLMRAIKAAVNILTIGQVNLSTSSIFKAKSKALIGGIQNLLVSVSSGPTNN